MTLIVKDNKVYVSFQVNWNDEIKNTFINDCFNPTNYKKFLCNNIIKSFYESDQSIELCKIVVNECGIMLAFVKNPTYELYDIALNDNIESLLFINDIEYIKSIPNYEDIYFKLLQDNINNLRYIKKELQTYKLIEYYINQVNIKHGYGTRGNEYIGDYEDRIVFYYNYIKLYTNEICNLIVKNNDVILCRRIIKNVDYLIKHNLVEVETKELYNCIICDQLQKYYIAYSCNKKHILCYYCSLNNETCYYKCNNSFLNKDIIYINTNYKI